jgi:isopenicillin N synthase-like dioxygenase
MAATGIPLIDLDRWFEGDSTERRAFAVEVDKHLQRLGFLLVINHRGPASVMDECRANALTFFHLPPEIKAAVAVDAEAYRGWVGPGLEATAGSYGIETPPDLRESFTCGPVEVPDQTLPHTAPRFFAANRWPERPSGFQDSLEAWWRHARLLADELLDIFALALGLPDGYLRARCTATTADGTLNWYGPRGSSDPLEGQFRVGPHTDFGTLTILDREPGIGGLQVLDEDNAWIDAPYVEGALLVNTGDLLKRWTNDRWRSNEHRVLPPPAAAPTEQLLSLVFFHEPDHDALIEVLETCRSEDNPARYPAVSASEYHLAKMESLSLS